MTDYLETLGTYYDEKVKFLSDLISDKRDLLKCNGCDDSEKVFDESDVNRFVFSCGEAKGKCGTQITIEFPKYICYEKELQNLREKINEGINWSVISKYLDVDDELKRQEEKRDKCLLAIKYIEDLFNEKNMDDKKSHIQKFYDSRIEKMRLSKDLQKSLNKETDESKKSNIRKDYVLNQKKMFQETLEFKELLKSINPYLQTELPKVTISNENYKENIMKKRKKKTKEDKKEDKNEDKDKQGDNQKDKKPKKKKDSPKSPRHNLSEFKKDLRVSWNAKGQDNFGTVIEDPSDNRISIKDSNGKKKKIPYTRLTIVKEEKKDKEVKDEQEGVEEVKEVEEDSIDYFSGSKKYKWLSSFNKANPFKYKGLTYPTVEHAFHSNKISDDDPKKDEYQQLFTDENLEPNEAKKLGGKKNFEKNDYKLRKDWNEVRVKIMEECLLSYYNSNEDLKQKLIETGDVELNHKGFRIDDFWGIDKNGGENHHGKLLMKLREKFKEENNFEPEPQKEDGDKEDKDKEDKKDKVEGFDIPDNANLMKPNSIKDLKEGFKIIANYQGQELEGYVDKIDKRMKKNVNVILYIGNGEMQVKIPISDIIHVIL